MTVNDLDMTLVLRMSVNSLFTQVVSFRESNVSHPTGK